MFKMNPALALASMFIAALVIGCGGPTKTVDNKPKNGKPEVKEEGHVHPPHGPNGGHVVEAFNADKSKDHHLEWLYDDDSGKVTVTVLDEEMKNEVGIDAESVFVDVKEEGKTVPYELKAANRTEGENPTATRFELVDQKLTTLMADEKLDAMLRVTASGEEFKGKIVQHVHH